MLDIDARVGGGDLAVLLIVLLVAVRTATSLAPRILLLTTAGVPVALGDADSLGVRLTTTASGRLAADIHSCRLLVSYTASLATSSV